MLGPIRRPRALTRRHLAALAVGTLTAALVATAVTGPTPLFLAVSGILDALLVLAVLQLHRELSRLRATRSPDAPDGVQFLQRRLLAAVEKQGVAAAERHQALLATMERSLRRSTLEVTRLQRDQTREVEALLQLFRDAAPRAPMPSSGRWALNPTDLLGILFLIEQQKPSLVLELGSGTSSVWIAYALEKFGGRLVSIDHEAEFAGRTRTLLAVHGLDHVAEVRDTPLRTVDVDGTEFNWYDVDGLADVDGVDLMLVDGPPGSVGPLARYPAMHLLGRKLSGTATVILDDANRQDEQDVLDRWEAEFPGLRRGPQIVGQHVVLAYTRAGAPRARTAEPVLTN
ncbi:MAG TPA: class I SAM-dependent methyltransferase [Actinoplanes sp.]|nr:class I SAM-dependent methyltransferase [Actinoplanes sp.]